MGADDIAQLAGETLARAEWVALFLGLVGLYFVYLAWSGLQQGHTRGFGWNAEPLRDAAARPAAYVWAIAASALLLAAVVVWLLKA